MATTRADRGRWPSHLMLGVLCVIWIVPAVGLIVNSMRPGSDVAESGWWTVLSNPRFTLDNYVQAFDQFELSTNLMYSFAIAIPTTVCVLVVSGLAAYAFAWMEFRGRTILLALVVSLLVVPPQVTLAPMLKLLSSLGLAGTVPAVWIVQVGLSVPFGVFVLRSAFAGIPRDLIEAAKIDGATQLTTYFRVVVPVSVPAIAAVGILQFLWAWNDLLSPLIFLGATSDNAPVTLAIAGMVQSTGLGENVLVASAVIGVVAPLVVFFGLQRFFVRGVLEGAVKG